MTPAQTHLRTMSVAQAREALEPALFDGAFYAREAGLSRDDDAFEHYFGQGARAGLRPNPVFDPAWYVARNPLAAEVDPLLHYAVIGEAADRDPSALFDVGWYRRAYGAERPLAHYLQHRFGPFSPVPEFDAGFYLDAYPDVAAARLDPFLHYLHFGFREFRKPRAGFNPRFFARTLAAADRGVNPVVHLRAAGAVADPPSRLGSRLGPYEEARRFGRRGPRFEPLAPPAEAQPRALVLAFHLTQYHRVPENDAWWGEGFTEWTQLARGALRFAGHYQPRLPGALGFYDLTDPEALRAQARLARGAGIGGFVFYYYNFDGRRLLEKPLELFLTSPDIDMPFCLMWANENWTRRWDGAEDEVLIAQSYDERHEVSRAAELVRHFRDSRYIRLQGRPLLMVYRAGLIPETAAALARWRGQFAALGETPIFVMAQTFDDVDPRPLGFDAAIEFPPHKLTRGLPQVYDQLDIFDENFEADVFAYDDLVDASLGEASPDHPLIKTAVPSWDNDARRGGQGLTLVGSSPRKFELWLADLISRAKPLFGAKIVAVNAWNEWSEGAYLEPDVHFGHAYLNAASRAIHGIAPAKTRLAMLVDDAAVRESARRLAAAFGVVPTPVASGEDALCEAVGDDDDGLRAAFSRFWPDAPKISVFVAHRGGPFPPQRLRSIFAQTCPVWEIVALDATEDSLEAVDAEARAADRDVALGLGVADALAEAADMAGGDFVIVADSHGCFDPTALAALSRPLLADPKAAFAFCDSRTGAVPLKPNPLSPRKRLASFADRMFSGGDFLALLADGPAPDLSAILWRREALRAALAAPPPGESDAARLIAQAAGAPGATVAHVAEALNLAPARA